MVLLGSTKFSLVLREPSVSEYDSAPAVAALLSWLALTSGCTLRRCSSSMGWPNSKAWMASEFSAPSDSVKLAGAGAAKGSAATASSW